jgi:hypothetical protein
MSELNNRGWNYSEEYRNQCEARDLLTWPLGKRRKQLALVLEKRGEAGYYKLTEEMKKQWEMKKLAQAGQSSLSSSNQESLQKPKQIELI